MIGTVLAVVSWIVLLASLLAYGGDKGLNLARLARWRLWYAGAGVVLMLLAFVTHQAVVFGCGFTALFASAGPLLLHWLERRRGEQPVTEDAA